MFDPAIEEVLKDLEQLRADGIYPNIDRESAEFLYDLIIENKPKVIIEVGSCNGYSTIWLGLAAKKYGGSVQAVEWGKERCQELINNLDKVNLTEIVTVHNTDAKEFLAKVDYEVNFVFIDAMKREYINYLKLIEDKLSQEALVVADNIDSHKEKVTEYIDYVSNHPGFETEHKDLGSGLLISKKIKLDN